MKKTLFLVIMAFALAVCASADNALSPVFYKMKAGDKISLKGNFCVFNGSAPNVRFVTDDNKILGVGKEESCSNEDVNKILSLQVENDAVYEVEAVFEYAGNVNLEYYKNPLMCFTVGKIKILGLRIASGGLQITVRDPKYNKKKKTLKAEIEIANAEKSLASYSNQYLFLEKNGKSYRAYLDSPASSVIDFASVEIPPGASVKKKIYFVMEEDASSDNIWYDMKPSYVEVGL